MKKPTIISDTIIKGEIGESSSEEKYDQDGYKFRQTTINIDGKNYVAPIYNSSIISFSEGHTVLLEYEKKGEKLNVLAGINISVNESWGKSPRRLKKYIEPYDRFILVRGKVTEKRIKNETQLASDNSAAEDTMNLIINSKQYNVPMGFGKKVTLGDDVAIVLHGPLQRPFAWQNFTTGKKSGNFSVHYLLYLSIVALAYGCFLAYQSGRMDWVGVAIVMALMGGMLWFMGYTMQHEYVRKKQAMEYIRLSKPSL